MDTIIYAYEPRVADDLRQARGSAYRAYQALASLDHAPGLTARQRRSIEKLQRDAIQIVDRLDRMIAEAQPTD